MSQKMKGITLLVLAVILFGVSGWCFLWIFSSYSLAFSYCESGFSLFAEPFRCKQPYIAAIIWFVSGTACVVFAIKGFKTFKGSKHAI